MKRTVLIARIIFWLSYVIIGVKVLWPPEPNKFWWTIIVSMACSFALVQIHSSTDPQIKKGRYYKLEKIIPHADGSLSIILSYDDKVETYKCGEILANLNPQIGNEYLVEIETGTVIFTPI